MNTEVLINSLLVSDSNSLGLIDIALGLILPFLLSFPATLIYQRTQTSNTYSAAFIHSFFIFASLSSIMTMIIGSNIARAFGLIGALSIIRFRNALKSPIDAVYIFWSLAIGMACGTGFYLAAVLLTAVIGVMALILKGLKYGEVKYTESILRVQIEADNEENQIAVIEKIFKEKTVKFNRVNIIFDSTSTKKTYVYQVAVTEDHVLSQLQSDLGKTEGICRINLVNSTPSMFAA